MDALHRSKQAVGALDNMAVALDTDEQADFFGRLLKWTIFQGIHIDRDSAIGHTVAQ